MRILSVHVPQNVPNKIDFQATAESDKAPLLHFIVIVGCMKCLGMYFLLIAVPILFVDL